MDDLWDTYELVPKVMANAQYRDAWPVMREFMARSRRAKDEPKDLLELQREMAEILIGLQHNRREIEAHIGGGTDRETGSSVESTEIMVCKKLTHIVKTIGDGIAWRTLRYNRAEIYQLAMKSQTGALDVTATAQEFAAAHSSAYKEGLLSVVNCVTNVLRYGDCTVVDADGFVTITEVKGGRGSKKSGKALRQKRNLQRKVDFLNTGIGMTLAGPSATFVHSCALGSHLPAVRDVIEEARGKGSAHARLSDCLAVEVFVGDEFVGSKPERHNPFDQSSTAFTYTSLDFFSRYARNVAPYSVFPFSVDDCTDLLTGALVLVAYFNHGNLVRCLRRRELLVHTPSGDEFERFVRLSPGERKEREHEISMTLGRTGDPRVLTVHQSLLARHFYEFLDESSFVDAVVETLNLAGNEDIDRALYPSYAGEAELWD